MENDFESLNERLNQLIGQNIAQRTTLALLCAAFAGLAIDWRNIVDDIRMPAEWTLKALPEGTEEERTIRSSALSCLSEDFDEIHGALLRREQNAPRSDSTR